MPGGSVELREWVLRAEKLWMFLDYDGTLADFADNPGKVEQNPRVVEVLGRLLQKDEGRFRLAILSGRTLADLRRLLPLSGLVLGGVYGLEFLTSAGEVVQRIEAPALRRILQQIKILWEEAVAGRNGFYLEDKGLAVALHSRWAEAAHAEEVMQRARRLIPAGAASAGLRILGGHRFLEVAPALADKGKAVSYLLKEFPLPNARPLYVGDDDKDEEAFPVIHANGGVAAKVFQPSQASRSTIADYLLASPNDVLEWLESLV